MLADFQFLRPEWLLLLPLVVVAAVFFSRRRFSNGHWERIVDPALAPHVLTGKRVAGRDYRWWLFALTGVLAVTALAGPTWERLEQPVFRSEQSLVVALDLSRSMDATDIAPSRIARARLKILDLLQRRSSGQTALIVYSANAFTVTPLTNDADTVQSLVNSLSTDIMPSRGSYAAAAIFKGQQLLQQAAVSVGEVLLITDGGSSAAAERAARDLVDNGYTLSVLGVGTRDGAPIPRSTGGFVTDNSGQIAVPRLEEASLKKLAREGGGRFATLSADNRDLDYLLSGEAGTRSASDDSQATDQWREQGPLLLLFVLPLAAMAFRRGWTLLLLVFVAPLLSLPQTAEAGLWDDLWLNRNQQAARELEAGEPQAAAELFEDDEWRAVARYRSGEFARSASQFADFDDARNLYNLGNSLAMSGQFEPAIDAYDEALALDPDNEDARYNRELLQSMLDQQQQQQQEGESQESSDAPGGESQDSDQPPDPNQEANSQSDGESEDGEPSDDEQNASAEEMQALEEELQRAAEESEQQDGEGQLSEEELMALRQRLAEEQAMEQWLRRIPNDPGGLLRRKFRYQYQRLGKDQDGNALWPDNEVQPW